MSNGHRTHNIHKVALVTSTPPTNLLLPPSSSLRKCQLHPSHCSGQKAWSNPYLVWVSCHTQPFNQSCSLYFQKRSRIRPLLSTLAASTLDPADTISHLDHCNSLPHDPSPPHPNIVLPQHSCKRDPAKCRSEHVTPLLKTLQSFPSQSQKKPSLPRGLPGP